MNISHKDLSDLYRSYLRSRIPSSPKGCPEPGKLWSLFDHRTRERTKSRLLSHIGGCSSCAEEFLAVLEILRATQGLEDEIGRWKENGRSAEEHLQGLPGRAPARPKRWQLAFLAAGGIVMALTVFALLRTGPFSAGIQGEVRDRARPGIKLLQPGRGADLSTSALLFRWRRSEDIDSYILELFDETLARMWRSDFVAGPELVPPSGVLSRLRPGVRYFWMITGYDRRGRTIESDLASFRIFD